MTRCESKFSAIKSHILTHSACRYKNYVPKCSQFPHELFLFFYENLTMHSVYSYIVEMVYVVKVVNIVSSLHYIVRCRLLSRRLASDHRESECLWTSIMNIFKDKIKKNSTAQYS